MFFRTILLKNGQSALAVALSFLLVFAMATMVSAQSRTYALDADFDEGTLINVNHDAVPDQLQLNTAPQPFEYINVAASGRGTVVRINTVTGEIMGEYRTAPDGHGHNPSRTTVDLLGNVWVANRDDNAGGVGSVTRVGLVIGGTRCDADGTPNPTGQYLKPPFNYSTVVDRDGDGLIKTSFGLGNVLPWTNPGGVDDMGGVTSADDECIINYVRITATGARTVAIDANNDVWVGGTGNRWHEKLDGVTGQPIPGTQFNFGCGGYGGFVGTNGVLWSARGLLRYDPGTGTGLCLPVSNSYGLAQDLDGNVWNSRWTDNRVAKLAPDGSTIGNYVVGGSGCRGVAVTSSDNNIWIACSNSNSVSRMNSSGGVIKTIPVQAHPTGVAVDAEGKVWVTCYYGHSAQRIDPAGGGDGLGAVDLTVSLGSNAYPYNYSDMTGAVVLSTLHGAWFATYDGHRDDIQWSHISWTADEPEGTSITVEARSANTETGLPSEPWMSIMNGSPLSGLVGRYVEVRVSFDRDQGVDVSPVLFDLTISGIQDVFVDIKPTSCPNPLNIKATKSDAGIVDASAAVIGFDPLNGDKESKAPVIPAAILGTEDFDVSTIDASTVTMAGIPVTRWAYEDVATPVSEDAEECECTTEGPDGYRDLTLKFDQGAVAEALGMVYDGEVIPITIAGFMYDGGMIEGTDCMIIRGPKAEAPAAPDPFSRPSMVTIGASPNPFNPTTTISFSLPESAPVLLEVYNIAGQRVTTLVDDVYPSGHHSVVWDGSSAASGVYFYRIAAGDRVETRKMLLMK